MNKAFALTLLSSIGGTSVVGCADSTKSKLNDARVLPSPSSNFPHERGAGGPLMLPGRDCNECHAFAIAGTVYSSAGTGTEPGVEAVRISLTDANGKAFELISNEAGNFISSSNPSSEAEALTEANNDELKFPVTASVTLKGVTKTMLAPVTNGSCSSCHANPPAGGAPGRLFVVP